MRIPIIAGKEHGKTDWAVIDRGPGYGLLPCHLHAFIQLDDMPTGSNRPEYGGIVLKDGIYAVVEEAKLDDAASGDKLRSIQAAEHV
jgi:hypothetical protein